jgi:hypothetical protein
MKLSELYTTRDVKVTFPGGKSLNVTYAAEELTPKVESDIREASNAQQVAQLVALLVKSWDLEDEGQTVELTPERLQTVPLIVLGVVIKAITADIADSTRAEGNS